MSIAPIVLVEVVRTAFDNAAFATQEDACREIALPLTTRAGHELSRHEQTMLELEVACEWHRRKLPWPPRTEVAQ